jgi:putative ABC transport system permease protein
MWRHYLSLAARGFVRHKLYSFINVAGLSLALTCAVLIALFVTDQLSYDSWIPDTANLYRLEVTFHIPGQPPFPLALCPFPVLTAAGAQIPAVKAVTHAVLEPMTVMAGDRAFRETITVVDPNFFQVIRLPLAEGRPAQVLQQHDSIVLSQTMARKLFGGAEAVGQSLRVGGDIWPDGCRLDDTACFSKSHTLVVTGVMRDLPHNTQLVADLVMPNTSEADAMPLSDKQQGWTSGDGVSGYVELAPGAGPRDVLAGIAQIVDRSVDEGKMGLGTAPASRVEQFDLTPFREVHLTSDKIGNMRPTASRAWLAGLTAIGLLIVLVAGINFTNLTTARAGLRAREIALRRMAGARRSQLVTQFVLEAVSTVLISLVIALALLESLLPIVDRFLDLPLSLSYLSDWKLLVSIIAGTMIVGLLCGLYPALVLSGFRPAAALKTGGSAQRGSGILRSALVIGQFAVSIALGVAVFVVFRQIQFARSHDWGFNRSGMVVIRGIENLPLQARESLAAVLKTGPGIAGTALSTVVPFDMDAVRNSTVRLKDGDASPIAVQFVDMTPSFPSLYGMRLLAGRMLSKSYGNDVSPDWSNKNILINLEMAHRLGLGAREAVGKGIEVDGAGMAMPMRIVGVLDDAMFDGVRSQERPTLFMVDPARYLRLSVRLRGDSSAALAFIDHTLRAVSPTAGLSRYFMSTAFNELFQEDRRQGEMFAAFVVIAMVIACLGLFGLTVFTAERRTKEIGIRKISGARIPDIVRLMLWRISAPVLAANVVAWPAAYWYLHRWLQGYPFRISLEPSYFLAVGAAALAVAWATVYAHTVRLARTSPVHALRYE